MFDDLRDLYQEVILDHGRKPRALRRCVGKCGEQGAGIGMTGALQHGVDRAGLDGAGTSDRARSSSSISARTR